MIYERKPHQTVCTMKEATGRSCHGSLKKYLPFAGDFGELNADVRREIAGRYGERRELSLYKCNYCQTVYADPIPVRR